MIKLTLDQKRVCEFLIFHLKNELTTAALWKTEIQRLEKIISNDEYREDERSWLNSMRKSFLKEIKKNFRWYK